MTTAKPKTRLERQAELMAAHQQVEREPTATERLHALELRRAANGGFLIPMPAGLTFEMFRNWLREISELGGPGDVEVAWHYVSRPDWKAHLRNWYEANLIPAASSRYRPLLEAAHREQQQAHADWEARTKESKRQREIAETEARLAVLRAQ